MIDLINTHNNKSTRVLAKMSNTLHSALWRHRLEGTETRVSNVVSSPCTCGGLPPSGCQTPAAGHIPYPGWFCRRHIWEGALLLLFSVPTWLKASLVVWRLISKEQIIKTVQAHQRASTELYNIAVFLHSNRPSKLGKLQSLKHIVCNIILAGFRWLMYLQ